MEDKFSKYHGYFLGYINRVRNEDLLNVLSAQIDLAERIFGGMTEEQSKYRYAEGKWSPTEMIVHINDTERIMSYRALAFSRGESQALPSFDENLYAMNSEADRRTVQDALSEFKSIRQSTISLFVSFSDDQLGKEGRFSGQSLSVEGLGYLIAGHLVHHFEVLQDRYFKP